MNLITKARYICRLENFNTLGSLLLNNIPKTKCVPHCHHTYNKLISSSNAPFINCLNVSLRKLKFNSFRLSKYSQDSSIKTNNAVAGTPEEETKPEGLFARFKRTYKQHGKIFICVHIVTSVCWAGSLYAIAYNGFDLEPILRWLNIGESYIEKLNKPGVGVIAAAYLMYKLISPLRYAVTIGGTQFVVRYMKRKGKMVEVPESNKIRSLIKEGRVQVNDSYRRRRRKKLVGPINGKSNP